MFAVDHFNILQGASNPLNIIHFLDKCLQQQDIHDNPKINSGDASGHAGHAVHD